jgi:(2R)-3-sulfolactate dehydrogenase (NADP+)
MLFSTAEAHEMAVRAAIGAGASERSAASLADATVSAEARGVASVGFAHFVDYLDGLAAGRVAGAAEPTVSFPSDAMVRVDANRGIAQLGFDVTFDEFVGRTQAHGVAVFLQSNSFTTGELGYYTRRLAERGLVALAGTNAQAMLGTLSSRRPVFGTNPISLAAPQESGLPFVLDQACSATAFVNVRRAAQRGDEIPSDWALDSEGQPTVDAHEALQGTLLSFGGWRGANIALLVEILVAGLTGGNWSLDAPKFESGDKSPSVGLFVVAFAPHDGFAARLGSQLARLSSMGLTVPTPRRYATEVEIPEDVFRRIKAFISA